MHRVLVLGAGKIGALITGLLADAGGQNEYAMHGKFTWKWVAHSAHSALH